jgi:DNA adenine methylase
MVGPLSYIGGKNRIAKRVIALFPPHTTYVEPFAGGAQVFFHKQPSKVEVLNDLDGEIVNFFRICQAHHSELIRYLRFMLVSRQWYEVLRATDPAVLTDIQRAARYLYILKASFAGIVRRPSYHFHVVQPPGFNPKRLPQLIEKTHKRLERVQIENSSYERVLSRYDRKTTFFYLDPPYFGRALYRHNLTTKDFGILEERLQNVQGKFILSLNDVPEVRTIFRRFWILDVELHYTAQKTPGRRYREVLIMNFQ